jgi:hypothetical protein
VADQERVTIRALVLYAIEGMLDSYDEEVAARERREDLERLRDAKFEEIVALLGGDITGSKANATIELHELAEAQIRKWRDYAVSDHRAKPRTAFERLCMEYDSIEADLEAAQYITTDTFDHDLVALDDEVDEEGDLEYERRAANRDSKRIVGGGADLALAGVDTAQAAHIHR